MLYCAHVLCSPLLVCSYRSAQFLHRLAMDEGHSERLGHFSGGTEAVFSTNVIWVTASAGGGGGRGGLGRPICRGRRRGRRRDRCSQRGSLRACCEDAPPGLTGGRWGAFFR